MNHLDDDSIDIDIELIEKYHRGLLVGRDLEQFIQREKSDEIFADKVKSYTEIMEGIAYYGMQLEFSETIQGWEKEIKQNTRMSFDTSTESETERDKKIIPIDRKNVFWWAGAIAASVLIVILSVTVFQKDDPQYLAETYIENNLTTLSTTMNGDSDRLATGISAFNNKQYSEAESIFRSLSDSEDLAPETAKYLGLTYLLTGQYRLATEQFNKLISYKDLYANPGKFYLAITLMKRGREGDEEQARNLLQEVVSEKLPGQKEASEWLKHF